MRVNHTAELFITPFLHIEQKFSAAIVSSDLDCFFLLGQIATIFIDGLWPKLHFGDIIDGRIAKMHIFDAADEITAKVGALVKR